MSSRNAGPRSGWRVEDLLDQVVEDDALAAGEGLTNEAGRRMHRLSGAAPGRERRQLQSGRPALGARPERRHLLRPRSSPITPPRKAPASSAVKPRSAARSSASWPRARRRASGSGGSARVVRPPDLRREVVDQERDGRVHRGRADDVVVVEHDHGGPGRASIVDEAGHHVLDRRAVALQEQLDLVGRTGTHDLRAPTRCARNARTSSSAAASDSQIAVGRRIRASRPVVDGDSHWVSRVVFPNPAGAETSTRRGAVVPDGLSRPTSRSRATSRRRAAGTRTEVPRTGIRPA